jgi:hypothetical protein
MFGQFLGGCLVSLECLVRLNPELLIESTGIPGALPIFGFFGGSKILVYMHYPTITTSECDTIFNPISIFSDMIQRVNQREQMYNNDRFIARSSLLSSLKYYYYMTFAWVYQQCGRWANIVLVNGT